MKCPVCSTQRQLTGVNRLGSRLKWEHHKLELELGNVLKASLNS